MLSSDGNDGGTGTQPSLFDMGKEEGCQTASTLSGVVIFLENDAGNGSVSLEDDWKISFSV